MGEREKRSDPSPIKTLTLSSLVLTDVLMRLALWTSIPFEVFSDEITAVATLTTNLGHDGSSSTSLEEKDVVKGFEQQRTWLMNGTVGKR